MPLQVLDEYRKHDLLRGRTIRVHHKTREEDDPQDFDADVLGVDADGQLRVRPVGGGPERALSGEEVSITPLHLSSAPRPVADSGQSDAPHPLREEL